jgi:hypothetical protein
MDELDTIGSDIWLTKDCSVLEMLIAMSKRIELDIVPEHENTCADWFWLLIGNLGLDKYDNYAFDGPKVDEILKNWLDRNGKSVLFFSEKSNTKTFFGLEYWYQMHIWLAENYENE